MAAALKAAQQTASEHGENVVPASLQVDTDGTARVTIQREASTLVIRHIHALHSWTVISATGSGRSVA